MPWKKLIAGTEDIVGTPGVDGLVLDSERLEALRGHIRRLGLSRLRARDIADGYLSLLPKSKRSGKGVYYTPRQVVEFILDEVLPPPRTSRKKQEPYANTFRILEPACGAGYFLLAAFSRLRQSYIRAGFKPADAVREVLDDKIAGIDIDGNALLASLLGLVQEAGEDLETAFDRGPIRLGLYRADFLDKSVDGSESALGRLLQGGIPAIVGNPPYVSFYSKRAKSISQREREYYRDNYRMGKGRINTYCLFIERAFELLAPSGTLGFIVPNTLLIMKSYEPLRAHLLEHGWLKSIVDLSLKVFPEVEVPTCILTVERRDDRALPFPRKLRAGFWESARGVAPADLEQADQKDFQKLPYTMFNIHIRSADREVLEAIERAGRPLGEIFEVRDGINPANMTEKLVVRSLRELGPPFRPVLRGKDIAPYQLNWDNLWVRYDPAFADREKGEYFFLREERIFKHKPKILTRQTADRIVAAWDEEGYYALNSLHVTIPLNGGMCRQPLAVGPRAGSPPPPSSPALPVKCLLALYNSRILNYYYRLVYPDTERVFPQVKTVNVERLPLPPVDGEIEKLEGLADKLLGGRDCSRPGMKERQKALDEIDKVLYSLYKLDPGQISRIERSTGNWTTKS